MTEILAPVGNIEMLEAGLAAGADSFYLGLDDFGARAYAENFTLDNIEEIIDYIHIFGKKVFVTMNILIKDSEIDKALSYVEKLYSYGVDGLLIQDIGLFHIIKDQVPNLDLHASTQMAVRDFHGAKALMDLGFKRIVIARETPIEEIEKISKLPCEKEVFVHGSLCVSYSGECLMSSYYGDRSANRGRCAGVCRLEYDLIKNGKTLGSDYYLSMKDLNTIDRTSHLIDLGIDCLKIEGRMKSPEYVYTAVKSYKSMVDKSLYRKDKLRDISNRGYSRGFIFGQNSNYILRKDDNKHRSVAKVKLKGGKKVFKAKTDLDKGDNLEVITDKGKKLPLTLTEDIRKNEIYYLDKYPDAKLNSDISMLNSEVIKDDLIEGLSNYRNIPVKLSFKARINDNPSLVISCGDQSVKVYGHEIVEKSKNIDIAKEDIRENLERFNDEVFTPISIDIDIESDIFIRKKTINKLRRDGVSKLEKSIAGAYKREEISINKPRLAKKKDLKSETNVELMTENIDPEILKKFDNVYINSYDHKYKGLNLYLNLDSHKDYEINELISYIKKNSIKGVIFNNYRDLDFISDFKDAGIDIRIGRFLNILNSYALDFYSDFSSLSCFSVEADLETINKNASNYPLEILVYGRISLMNMVHCPFSTIKKCGLKGCKTCKFRTGELRSKDGNEMFIIRKNGISRIYPKGQAGFDEKLLNKGVSKLVSVFSNEDIKNHQDKNYKHKLNYKRGVI